MADTSLGRANVVIRAVLDKLDDDLGAAKGKVEGALGGLGSKLSKTFLDIGKIAAGIGLEKLFSNIVGGVKDFAGEAVMGAARASELKAVLDLLGQRAGWTTAQIRENEQAVRDLGIRTDTARGLLSQFARYQLDAADATMVARVAQDAAVLSMKDSSEALEQIMHGVLTQNSGVLRNAGLNIMASDAMNTYATTLGKTTAQLTETERIQAMLNAVQEEGLRIAGAYETAMEEPGKALRSLKRHVYEASISIGDHFLPALGTVVNTATNVMKHFRGMVDEGGALYPLFQHLGAGASLAADHFSGLAMRAVEAGENLYTQFGGRVMQVAENALSWGINISTQLASGIIQGAASALVAAMNYVSSILSWFLAPGSPPRVAPDIDTWGMQAMNEWLGGFTSASFDILEGVQRPLQTALQSLVSAEEFGQDVASGIFREISAELIGAATQFEKTGQVSEAVFEKLRNVGGGFGDSLAELARRQFAVAAATDRAREASERLKSAQKEQEDSQDDLAKITDEYQSMLLRGASYEELSAKKAEMAAAKERKSRADAAIDAAEAEADASKEQLAIEKERLQLQSRLISQLEQLAKAQLEMAKVAPEALAGGGGGGGGAGAKLPKVGGGGGGGLPQIELPQLGGLGGGLTAGLDDAFEQAKETIADKFATLFAPVREAWEADIKPALDAVAGAWETFSTVVGEIYTQYIQPIIDKIAEFIPADKRDSILETIGKIVGVLLTLKAAAIVVGAVVAGLGAIIGALTSPIGLVIAAIAVLAVIWETNLLGIRTAIENAWAVIKAVFGNIQTWITGTVIPVIRKLYDAWVSEIWPAIQRALENTWTVIRGIWEELGRWINTNIIPWLEALKALWVDTVWPAIQRIIEVVWRVIEPIWESLVSWMAEIIPVALEGLRTAFDHVMNAIELLIRPVKTIWDLFVTAVKSFWDWISNKEFDFKIKLPDLPKWALPGSPLPIHTAWKDFAQEMNSMTIQPRVALNSFGEMATRPQSEGKGLGQVIIYNLTLEGVQDRQGLLAELQALT